MRTRFQQDLSPNRIAHRKLRFDLVAQKQIFRPITETKGTDAADKSLTSISDLSKYELNPSNGKEEMSS